MSEVRSLLAPLAIGGLIGAVTGTALHFAATRAVADSPLERRVAADSSQDAAAALAALETIADPAAARAAALTIVTALGDNAGNVERVALHLRPGARLGFRAEAHARWAQRDASSALAAAITASTNPAAQWTLLQRIALALAGTDPEAAWRTAAEIADGSQRGAFRAALLAEWALLAPEAALDFLERVNPAELPVDLELPRLLIAAAPERILAASAKFGLRVRLDARREAFAALAARDPERALELLSALIPQSERSALLASIATGYGLNDPPAALAWAEARPDASSLLPAVVSGIASADFPRALALIDDAATARREEASAWASSVMNGGVSPDEARRLLDALAANEYSRSAGPMASALYIWARDDARSAVDWLIANLDKVPVDVAGSVANRAARADEGLAISVANQLPADRRGDWVWNVVRTVAASDAGRALALLEPYRGEPFFAEAARGVAAAGLLGDPAGAAGTLALTGAETTPLGARVAGSWAARNPAAAATWVSDWPAGEARREALRGIAEQWGRRDLEAGFAFALSQRGTERDAALTGLAEGAARNGIADERIFASFGSDEAKLAAADRVVARLGERYPQRARQLIESVAADPARKEALEITLARTLMHRFVP